MTYSIKLETIKYVTLETPFAYDEYGKEICKIMINNIQVIKQHKIIINPKQAVLDVEEMINKYKNPKMKLNLVKGHKKKRYIATAN